MSKKAKFVLAVWLAVLALQLHVVNSRLRRLNDRVQAELAELDELGRLSGEISRGLGK